MSPEQRERKANGKMCWKAAYIPFAGK